MLFNRLFSSLFLCLCVLSPLVSVQAGEQARPNYTMVSYMGWLPTSYNSSGIVHPTDFPVMSMLGPNGQMPAADERGRFAMGQELKLLADHGWDCMLADFLFFNEANVKRQIGTARNMMEAADLFALPQSFQIASFLETMGGETRKDPVLLGNGLVEYLKAVGDHPRHLKIDGRPVLLFYGANSRSPQDWQKAMGIVREQGLNPFIIYEHGGLMPALFGTFNPKEAAGFGDLFDGSFNFGASALEAGTNMVTSLRKAYGNQKAGQYVGGTIWPGYLSDRTNNRNFTSPRNTEFLRNVWESTLKQKPDFLQWSTWNDYHEATSLSCTFSQLTSRMEISQRYLAQYHNKPLPNADDGKPQSVLSYRKTLQSGEPVSFEFLPLPCVNVSGKARVHVTLLDERNQAITQQRSDMMDMQQMQPWNWSFDAGVLREQTRVIRVRASLEWGDGQRIDYANLPDIAVVRGISYSDQLFYNVPLHRMAEDTRSLRMLVNGEDGSDGQAALHEGLRVIDYKVTAPNADKAQVSAMRDGHLLRFLAPLDCDGAYTVNPDHGDVPIVLRKRDPKAPSSWCDWREPVTREGEDYYGAVVQFADGKWAYSPTVWSIPSTSYDQTSVLWAFVPQPIKGTKQTSFKDWSGHEAPVTLAGDGVLGFDVLPGNAKMLKLNGKQVLSAPLDYAPNGPMSVDVVINPTSVDRTNVICYQRGAQMSMIIRPDGLLEARRLPEVRSHPNPHAIVQSQSRLEAGRFYHIVVTYDGKQLAMYLNGQLQSQVACVGTRSAERCLIGGNLVDGASKEVDNLEVEGGFTGRMLRMHVIAGAWTPETIEQRYDRVELLPFWK